MSFSENVSLSGSCIHHVAIFDTLALFSRHTWNSPDKPAGIETTFLARANKKLFVKDSRKLV